MIEGYERFLSFVDLNKYSMDGIPEHLIFRLYELGGVRVVNIDGTERCC